MIIELEINGARVIVSGDNLTVNVTEDDQSLLPKKDDAGAAPQVPTGAQIKALRKSLGLNQAEFAGLVGAAKASTVCRWEKDAVHPAGSSAIAIVRLMTRGQ